MKNRLNQNQSQTQNEFAQKKLLKVTSLLYLKEALYKGNYEDCPKLIALAENYGVKRKDVQKVVTRYVRRLRAGFAGSYAENYRKAHLRK